MQPLYVGGGGAVAGATSGGNGVAGAGGGTARGDCDDGPFIIGGASDSEADDPGPTYVRAVEDSPWLISLGGFSLQNFHDWFRDETLPWVAGGGLTRREIVVGVLAVQAKHRLANAVAEDFLQLFDIAAGSAAGDSRLPFSWRAIEQLLRDLLINSVKWCV